jgi:hypothetical protein
MGVLESEEAAEISEHLRTQCEYCLGRIKESSGLLGSFSALADITPPPPHLRERVLSIARPKVSRAPNSALWPVAFSLATAASIALLIWGLSERGTLVSTLNQLQDVSRQRNELRAAIEILSKSDTRTVKFGEEQARPHGRVFLSQSGGAVFVGSQLPQLTAGKTFELWFVPTKGNPQPAGLFKTNAEGISVNVLTQPINPADFAAVAVSIEPSGGSPQPTTKPILVVPLA